MDNIIDILGTKYEVLELTTEDQPVKLEDKDGYTELYSKKIIIRTGYEDDPENVENLIEYKKKILRHELIHAFFHECGLRDYCEDEVLVDFIAAQFHKLQPIIYKAEKLIDK